MTQKEAYAQYLNYINEHPEISFADWLIEFDINIDEELDDEFEEEPKKDDDEIEM